MKLKFYNQANILFKHLGATLLKNKEKDSLLRSNIIHREKSKTFLSFSIVLFFVLFTISNDLNAQTQTFPSGSYIINMGIVPQTINNGLRPYGLIYDLLKNNNIPIKWVINQTKVKDGIDFTYNGVSYKGGTFIIPGEYISVAVQSKITSYAVTGAYTNSTLTVNVTHTLTAAPNWTLDNENGKIAQDFFSAANIPSSAYNWTKPQSLGACNDIFVMPHADPTWGSHSNLYYWNRNHKGAIWAGCHAVSVLENLTGSGVQMNFLSTTGLVPFGSHKGGSPPYTHQKPTFVAAQYMGITDNAHTNGSEQIYLPKAGGAWRITTAVIAYDPTQENVPSLSSGQAAVIAHGRAFGNSNYGWVLYEAGHDIFKATSTENIAAVRAFFNFSFLASSDKVPYVSAVNIPSTMSGGVATPLSVTVSSPIGLALSYQWTSSCGGTFSAAISASTNFTPPTATGNTSCIIRCLITDACGRQTCQSMPVTISILPTGISEVGTVNVATGGVAITNIRSNDKIGAATATASNSTISKNGTWPTGITLNTTTGQVSVAIGTTPGVYPVKYNLCDLETPPNCVVVSDTVTITPKVVPVTENGTVGVATGGVAIANVRTNDKVNTLAATSSNSTIATVGTWPSGITFNTTTGAISVASGTTPGTYPVTYKLCDLLTPTATCANVIDNVIVTPLIVPVTESGTVTSATGGVAIANIRTNDKVNTLAATSTNSTVATVGTWPSGITLNTTTGAISVAAGTTPGTYNVTYRLCDKLTPVNCVNMMDVVKVTGAVKAVTENGTVASATGGVAITNIRTNDDVNGATPTSTNSTISKVGTWPTGISLNTTTGAVVVTAGTTPGRYPVTYQLCDLTTPTPNCDTEVDTVFVTGNTSIVPITESGTVGVATGGVAITNIRSNDKIGTATATSANSTIAQEGTWPTGITLNTTTGEVNVEIGITPGTYSITYKLCDLSTPTANCATVIDYVTVTPLVVPVTESGTVTSATGGVAIANIRTNDKVNTFAATSTNSTIETVGTWPSGITLNTTTGAVSVTSGTTPGNYNVTYRLCDKLTLQTCADMVDVVKVTGTVKAVTESGSVNYVAGGTAISNVRTNDLVNGVTPTSANSTISQVGTWPTGISLNTTTGAVNVVPGTTPGLYPVTYQLCDLTNPTPVCDTEIDTVNVAGTLNAIPDETIVAQNCGTSTSVTYNVLSNDSSPFAPLQLSAITPIDTLKGEFSYTSSGSVSYSPSLSFIGLQLFNYTVCDNASNCQTSTFAVNVVGSGYVPVPMDDAISIVEDNIAIISVLTNDASLALTVVGIPIIPINGKVSINMDGTITYIPNQDFAGTDTFSYKVRHSNGNYGIAQVSVTVINDTCDNTTMSN
jgi:hypothetical protein